MNAPKVIVEIVFEEVVDSGELMQMFVKALERCIEKKLMRQIIDVMKTVSRLLEESFMLQTSGLLVDLIRKVIDVRKSLEKALLGR